MSVLNFPILLIKGEDEKYYPHYGGGCNPLLTPSEVEPLINDLIKYCNQYTDEYIKDMNNQLYESHSKTFSKPTKTNNKKAGFIYVIRCDNKYKIGYSKNVERRIKQLDVRPFKINLVFKLYSDNAYTIEQQLHKSLKDYNITGEWYSEELSSIDLKSLIKEIEEELR